MKRKHIATREEIRAFSEFIFETSPSEVQTSLLAILKANARKLTSMQKGVINDDIVSLLKFLNTLTLLEYERTS